MDHLATHLVTLRQEITTLRDLNTLYKQQSHHSPLDQTDFDVRESRLLQIKRELSNMLNSPPDSSVWWEKSRKPTHIV